MRIATIGTSWITESFIDSSKYVDDIDIYAVYSRSEEKSNAFAQKNNVSRYYFSLDEMLGDENIDAVYIASPNSKHFEQAKMCLLAGKHVICEKPMVVTAKELEELYSIADSRNLILLEAMKSMHSDGLAVIKNALADIGEIRTAQIDFSQHSSKYAAYKRGENPNIFNPEMCTGALMDLGVYCVYFALEIFGEPENVISHSDFLESGSDCTGTLIFIYNDKTVTITYSKTANGFLGSRILGENGAITINSVSKLTGIKRYYNDGTTEELYPVIDENIVMSKEIEAFRDFVNGKNKDYYDYCRKTAFDSCRIIENIRKENNFSF
ncbi:MAG: Gfo/Idh/MocA family oxidoreductase [Clostridia bacterium]|nr:Gfo/Idh/MocA family oxidoreductase [Clostridia bacterium]